MNKSKTGHTVSAGAGARLVIRGGNLTNGANVSPAYVNANNGLSNTNTNNGSRLAEWSFHAVLLCTRQIVNVMFFNPTNLHLGHRREMASNLDWISFFLDFFHYLKKKSLNKNN